MCKLKIISHVANGEQLLVTIGDESKIVDQFSNITMFELSNGTHTVKIEQIYKKCKYDILLWVWYFFTIALQGIFHAISMNTEQDDIFSFLVSGTTNIKLENDIIANLSLDCSSDEPIAEHSWILAFSLDPDMKVKYHYCEQRSKENLLKYIKKCSSVGFLAFAMFSFLSWVAFKEVNILAGIICVAMLLMSILVCLYVLYRKTVFFMEEQKRILSQNND